MEQWHRDVKMSARWPTLIGLGVLLTWMAGFGIWAGTAPMDGAVVAPGAFVATGQNKHVQHLEGGIIRELLVKEGDRVEANQVVVRMDETAARAKLRRLVLRNHRLITMQARLEAEIRGSSTFEMPAALSEHAADPDVKSIVDRQRVELRARRESLAGEEIVLRKEIAGLEESIQGYKAQVDSTKQRMALFAEELHDKKQLYDRQLLRKTEILVIQRAEASLSGDLGELMGRIADSKERVARAHQRISQLHSAAIQKAVEELRQTETELDDIQEQIRAAKDVMERTEVRAPVRGIVVKSHFHTAGAVAAPGAVILELLPLLDELIIEARVNPGDIVRVHQSQEALVRLSALNQRVTPMIKAQVVYLSADALAGQAAQAKGETAVQRDYYIVRVRLDEADLRHQTAGFQPTPGMPADVYIKTGERTFFEYIMKPILDSFARAFREK
jgi:HlyD family secretion protein